MEAVWLEGYQASQITLEHNLQTIEEQNIWPGEMKSHLG